MVLHGGHVACQEQYNIIPMGQNVHSNAKHFYCSWHATWPPCKTSIWQIYLPAPRRIPRPKFDVATPNAVHQADLLFLPHDKLPRGRKVYKYALTVTDVASLYKDAITSKNSDEVAQAFQNIYKRSPLTWP